MKSYIRDGILFLISDSCKNSDRNALMLTFDVTNQYGSTNQEYRPTHLDRKIPRNIRPKILHPRFNKWIIPNSNSFKFDNNYLQNLVIAIGTKMASTYARLILS